MILNFVIILAFQIDIDFIGLQIQVGNRSSEFHPEVRRVRREGSYIYEEFMATGGTDVKVVSSMLSYCC